jgi:hypothetical protein
MGFMGFMGFGWLWHGNSLMISVGLDRDLQVGKLAWAQVGPGGSQGETRWDLIYPYLSFYILPSYLILYILDSSQFFINFWLILYNIVYRYMMMYVQAG